MSQNDTPKFPVSKFSRILVITFLTSFVAVAYNNCGQQAFQTDMAFVPVQKMQDDLMVAYQGRLEPSICLDARKYTCTHKIFSQDVEDSHQSFDFPCVTAGQVEFCVKGEQFLYNTAAAAKLCGENCAEKYEYEEFVCYYKLPNLNGAFPIQSTSHSLQNAIEETFAACLRVAGFK